MESSRNVENKTVAFLDVLGFRDLQKSIPLQELAEKYDHMVINTDAINRPLPLGDEVVKMFPDHHQNEPWCKRYIFSDSIILISDGDDAGACLKLLIYARKFLQALLGSRFPTRGGVAYGELYENSKTNVVIGKALTNAYELEQTQQWIGVAIDHTVEAAFPELFSIMKPDESLLSSIFLKYPVPLKDGSTEMLHTLNWRFNFIVEKGTRSLFSESSDKSVEDKVRNTLTYAKTVVESGKVYVQEEENCPVELRSFWVGSREPPFPHGDDL